MDKLLMLLVGGFLGHLLTLSRYRRKYFMKSTEQARKAIASAIDTDNVWMVLANCRLDDTRHALSRMQRSRLSRLQERFSQLQRDAQPYVNGRVVENDELRPEGREVLEAILKLLSSPGWKPW